MPAGDDVADADAEAVGVDVAAEDGDVAETGKPTGSVGIPNRTPGDALPSMASVRWAGLGAAAAAGDDAFSSWASSSLTFSCNAFS